MTHPSPTREPPGAPARYALYDRFAAIYNRHFGQYARRVVPVLERLVLCRLPEQSRVLDVCCGTGQLAAALAERGLAVTGVDGSAGMLRFARQNAPAADLVLEDVRAFDARAIFDAAVSTFDSINHLVEPGDLDRAFGNVFRALRPGGLFAFDMNMEEGYRARWWGEWHGSHEGDEFVIHAFYCPETGLGRNVVTWGGAGPADQVTFVERCYSEQAVREGLTRAGFEDVRVHDGHCDLGLYGEIGRAFFVCRKPGEGSAAPHPAWAPGAPSTRSRQRTLEQCVRDGVCPDQAVQRELGRAGQRLRAVEEVLSTFPLQPYESLRQAAGRFHWFIPGEHVLGQVHPFPAGQPDTARPEARVVYLSPLLERQDWAVVVTVVVHELAHVILGHELSDLDEETYHRQELSVRGVIGEWGFEPEAARAAATLAALVPGDLPW